MVEFHKIWIDQCQSARGIVEAFGTQKVLGYRIGEPTSSTRSLDSGALDQDIVRGAEPGSPMPLRC